MKFIESTEAEIALMQSLSDEYIKYSGMRYSERLFLSSLAQRYAPKKILEIGVSAGSSSAVLLNATKNIESELFSIDILSKWYRNRRLGENKHTGFVMDAYPELKKRWHLFTGHLSYKFMPQIGNEIDFCLIDTVHIMPGEILDYLMVLPYLKSGCVVVLHDVNLLTAKSRENNFPTTLLISAINGEKLLISNNNFTPNDRLDDAIVKHSVFTRSPNIAAVVITDETKNHVWEIFNLLFFKWEYFLEDDEVSDLANIFREYYGQGISQLFIDTVDFQSSTTKSTRSLRSILESK